MKVVYSLTTQYKLLSLVHKYAFVANESLGEVQVHLALRSRDLVGCRKYRRVVPRV